jgi:hypothetical protein
VSPSPPGEGWFTTTYPRTWEDIIREAQLLELAEALELWRITDADACGIKAVGTVDGVIDQFAVGATSWPGCRGGGCALRPACGGVEFCECAGSHRLPRRHGVGIERLVGHLAQRNGLIKDIHATENLRQ